jgi:hypothetical protein
LGDLHIEWEKKDWRYVMLIKYKLRKCNFHFKSLSYQHSQINLLWMKSSRRERSGKTLSILSRKASWDFIIWKMKIDSMELRRIITPRGGHQIFIFILKFSKSEIFLKIILKLEN